MTVTGIQIIEATLPDGNYQVTLADPHGNQFHHSRGATRELAIQGLINYGYTVTEE
jgi:hypothetical protein